MLPGVVRGSPQPTAASSGGGASSRSSSYAAAAAADGSGSSTTQQPCCVLSTSLRLQPPLLEQRFWARRCASRLASQDLLFELCNLLVWFAILPSLVGLERAYGQASLALSVTQLALIRLAPRVWVQQRSVLLSAHMLLRCAMLRVQQQQHADAAGAAAVGSANNTLIAVGLWGNVLFVLFHQQPVRLQAPLLALTTGLQAWTLLGRAATAAATMRGSAGGGMLSALQPDTSAAHIAALSRVLSSSFQQLVNGFLGGALAPAPTAAAAAAAAGNATAAAAARIAAAPPPPFWPPILAAGTPGALLSTHLFVCVFGGFVLPAFMAYVSEWRAKVSFLMALASKHGTSGSLLTMGVLTPNAAVARSSSAMALVLYAGWLLALAVACWLGCCLVAAGVAAA